MKKLFTKLLMACLVLTLFSQCKNDDTAFAEPDYKYEELGIEVHNDVHIKGQGHFNNHMIAYEVINKSGGQYKIDMQLDDKSFQVVLNYDEFYLNQITNGISFEQSELDAMKDLSYRLSWAAFVKNGGKEALDFETNLLDYSLSNMLEYYSDAPAGYKIDNRELYAEVENMNKSKYNDGIYCIKKGRTYTVYYDSGCCGTTYSHSRKANYNGGQKSYGDFRCMGRCGGGCGAWWVAKAWCLDCFDHDECVLRINGPGTLGNDSNCGDEWWHASDDYSFGVAAGCWG